MSAAPPFDPQDDFDASADLFRKFMAHMFVEAARQPPVARLDSARQLESFLCGALTGALGVAFAHVTPEGRSDVMAMIADYLPHARLNAEDMIRGGLH